MIVVSIEKQALNNPNSKMRPMNQIFTFEIINHYE